jgi:two-component system sensor histidine kinase KdpD
MALPGGRITISGSATGETVTLTVTDEGPGIAMADRERVFDQFYRAARGDGAPSGTGLGLAIVRGFVEAHGGRVAIDAGPGGRGSAIALTLPRAPASEPPEEAR